MSKSSIYIWLLLAFVITSVQCTFDKTSAREQNTESSIPKDSTLNFEAPAIGWSFDYPAGWEVLSEKKIKRLEGVGKDAVENEAGIPINGNNKNLLYLRKNALNAFTSTLTPYDSTIDGPYDESQEIANEMTIRTYKSQGVSLSHTTGKTTIGGLTFDTFKVTIFRGSKSDTLMQQIVFDRLMNDSTSLTFSIMFNSEENRKEIDTIMQSSEFN